MRLAAMTGWGNPSSVHGHGRAARAWLEEARAAVGELAGADPRDVLFTSGGTEANNLAVRSPFAKPGGALVTSRLEHPSVTRPAEELERTFAARVHWLAVTPSGMIDLAGLDAALASADVRLLALQAVNHETGVVQPVVEAISIARSHGVKVFVDAVQAWGKVDPLLFAGADAVSLAGHKIRGPKGVGALITRPGLRILPVLVGGSQERGIRPGTPDPIAAAGLSVAARHALCGPARYVRLAAMRDRLEATLLSLLAPPRRAIRVGTAQRAPHVTTLAWPGWRGAELVAALDLEGLSVSSGSACSAGTIEASPVVRAMIGDALASSTVRVSIGEETSDEEISQAAEIFARVCSR